MGLMSKPSRNIDLAKINEIQNDFFGEKKEESVIQEGAKVARKKLSSDKKITDRMSLENPEKSKDSGKTRGKEKEKSASSLILELTEDSGDPISLGLKKKDNEVKTAAIKDANNRLENQRIADLLVSARVDGIRHTSRPFTMPRSLTIDLNRLKSKFRSRNLQYTQNELIDKMLKESLETVTADNYFDLREEAFKFVKSPEQSSRRSVTLTEESVSGMAELKADLSLAYGRRFSSDEIFTTLLAIAFAPLYKNRLLP